MFEVLETHVHALIRCECGEYISLSGSRSVEAQTCDQCPHRYILVAQVLEVDTQTKDIVKEWTSASSPS